MSRLPARVLAASSPVVLVLAVAVGYPVLRLAVVAAEDGPAALTRTLSSVGPALQNTVVLAVVVTVVAVPLGIACALVLRSHDVPGRKLWIVCLLLPLIVPDFVLGYSWISAYAPGGLLDYVTGVSWTSFQGVAGVIVVLVVHSLPIAFLIATVGLATRAEPDLERSARASGASAATVMRTVTLPLLRPAIAAATVLVFVGTLASFAVPQVIGAPAGFDTVTTQIYANLNRASTPEAFVEAMTLALVLVVFCVVIVAPADMLLNPRLRSQRPAQSGGDVGIPLARSTTVLAPAVLTVYVVAAVMAPLLGLVLTALTRAVGMPPTPSNWSVENFRRVLGSSTYEAFGRSLALGMAAATILVVLGAAIAFLERRRWGRGFATLVTLTLVLPGSTLAVALLIAYGEWLAGSLTLILLAYIGKLWALAHRPIAGALDRLPPEEMRAARSSGAGSLTAIRTVALPTLAPALAAAWAVTFMTAIHEVTMSSLLYGPGTETIAVVVLNSQELGTIGPTAALSVLLTLVILVPAVLLWVGRWVSGSRSARTVTRAEEVAHAA